MRPQNDPDIRKYDSPGEMIPCPECHAWMLPLKSYEIPGSTESAGIGAEPLEFLLWGWWAFVYNYVYDHFTFENRKKKLLELKRQTLPQFPNSLVCPRCLHLNKRP